MYVIRMLGRWITLGCVSAPAVPGHPDLAEPDDVQDAEGVGVRHSPGREPVAVVAGVTGGDATETVGIGREVTGASKRMLTPCRGSPTRCVVRKSGQPSLGQRVVHARCDAAAGTGRV